MKKKQGLILLILSLAFGGCGSQQDAPIQAMDVSMECDGDGETGKIGTVDNKEDLTEGEESTVDVPGNSVTLKVYSQLSSWPGEQQGWFAKVMLDEFQIKLEYIWDCNEDTKWSDIADIIVFGNRPQYIEAVEAGQLLDWEKADLLAEHGTYILEHMPKALEYNRSLTPQEGKIFGLGNNVVPSPEVCEDFFLTWDIRWDLYKELGYPQVQDLEDMVRLFADMKALCPVDEAGEETYAVSLWPDWDQNMMMIAKCMATAYYGYDEHGLGLYDTQTGTFYGALEEKGPYLEMLEFYNTLYRKGLLDPDSRTQTYEDMLRKLENGGVFFSVFNYAGSMAYNKETHMEQNQYMASLLPKEASPGVYGLSVYGGHKNWAISVDTQYPELCMELINWFATPKGRMTQEYGPRGMFWDYDAEGNTYFTEQGKIWWEERATLVPEEYGGGYFYDGCPQVNNVTWNYRSPNPDSNGETYDCNSWKSNLQEAVCEMEQDWRGYTGAATANEYIKAQKYVVIPEAHYEQEKIGGELLNTWEQVAECIVSGSWDAIYADSEDAFHQAVADMQEQARVCGYELCMRWCKAEAERRQGLEKILRQE